MNDRYEYIVLGGGPAGIQLGYYLEKHNRNYAVLERGNRAGTFFETFPRHRQLISINKVHTGSDDAEFNMRHDWNSLLTDDYSLLFKQYDDQFFPHADSLLKYLNDFVAKFHINLIGNISVTKIFKESDGFVLIDDTGRHFRCAYLVVATGLSKPVKPDIEGIEFAECYSKMSLDRAEFNNARVLIIGKGNSAFETADHLISSASLIHLASPDSITMAWKSHYVGHLRAVNNNILDTYQLKSQNAILDADVHGIRKEGDKYVVGFRYAHAENEVEEIVYDRILCCAGFKFDDELFDSTVMPELTKNGKYPAINWEFESVNQPNMYFAGTITHSLDYRKTTSGFIHGFRYNVRFLADLLNAKNHGATWRSTSIQASPSVLAEMMLGRVNRSAGLWQQPGFIVDVIGVNDEGAELFKEMPVGFGLNFAGNRFDEYFTVSLEYGDPIVGDPFKVERVHRQNIMESHRSKFLHPIVRHYRLGSLVAEHNVIEDLEAIWLEEEHITPLIKFLTNSLQPRQGAGCGNKVSVALAVESVA